MRGTAMDDPSEAEIAERCLEIQATWTAETRHKRTVVKSEGWEVPINSAWFTVDDGE